jgi:hypothetical protein
LASARKSCCIMIVTWLSQNSSDGSGWIEVGEKAVEFGAGVGEA